ncbi:hypothetical protein P3T35_006815 [Kitasatospora sp. GP30]|uniref:HMG-box domain-containing protein n=1 Tax=Kitasatospora sp. GP30 TaxID=3035084 RepID=UPI000C7123F7|nr:HMG-box domain-containing protein [Kitasatospora sp. GP30]MDH6144766.1 hypothetical protein [Kitasatospora sp. GP30]
MTSASQGWDRLGGGGQGALVLAVDFDGSTRQEATFRDLARLLPDRLDVWHAVPPTADLEHADQYLAWWLETLPRSGERVSAVLGYCAGGVYAAALSDAIELRQEVRPEVVLFNPGSPNTATLSRDLFGALGSMTALNEDERQRFRQRAEEIVEHCAGDFAALADEFCAVYVDASRIAFERWGIEGEVGDELMGLFRAYTRYLSAARQLERRPRWVDALSLNSADHEGGFTGRETSFDSSRADLLRSPAVAAAVTATLTVSS